MAAITVPSEAPGYGLRSEVSSSEIARARADWEAARAENARVEAFAAVIFAIFVILVAAAAFRHRHRIVQATDSAAVASAAAGLRAARKARATGKSWQTRVIAKANDNTPPSI